jgi:L-fucose isomerase-like protein
MAQIKVGFVAFDHLELNHLVHAKDVRDEVISKIKKWPVDLYIVEELPSLPNDVATVAADLRRNNVDAVIFYLAGYCSEGLPLVLAMELDCPIIIWSTNKHHLTPLSILSYIATSRNLKYFGKKFLPVIGDATARETKEKIISYCKIISLVKKLHQSTVGIIGNYNPGQVDTIVDEFQLRRLVPGLLYLDTLELVKFYEEANNDEAIKLVKEKTGPIAKIKVTEATLVKAMKWYLAMKAMIRKYRLDAVTLRAWPELTEYKEFDRGLNAALLNEEGIVCIQEVDISAVITALMLQHFTASPAFCGEIRSLEEESFVLYHAGEAAFSLASGINDIALVPSNNNAVDLQITLKPGRITVAKLTSFPGEKSLRMLISAGEVLPAKDLVSGRAAALIKPDLKLEEFFNILTKEGFEHHTLIAYGDVKQEFIDFCNLMGIETIIV